MSLIKVMCGGKTEYDPSDVKYSDGTLVYPNGMPKNITGHLGFMDTDDLQKRTYKWDNENETGVAIEYWDECVLRSRSVWVDLKRGLNVEGIQGDLT